MSTFVPASVLLSESATVTKWDWFQPLAQSTTLHRCRGRAGHESELVTSGSYVKCRQQRLHAATPNIDMEHSLEPFKMNACNIAQHTDEVSVRLSVERRRRDYTWKNNLLIWIHSFLKHEQGWPTVVDSPQLQLLNILKYPDQQQPNATMTMVIKKQKQNNISTIQQQLRNCHMITQRIYCMHIPYQGEVSWKIAFILKPITQFSAAASERCWCDVWQTPTSWTSFSSSSQKFPSYLNPQHSRLSGHFFF